MTKRTPPPHSTKKHPHRLSVRELLSALLILFFVSTALHWELSAKYYEDHSADIQIQLQSIEDDQRQLIVPSTPSHASNIILPKYDKAMATQAIRKTDWICGDREPMSHDAHRPFVSFVHVYKTAGSTLRDFFSKYANLCRKSLMVVVGCTEVNPHILTSGTNWNKCRLKYVIDKRRNIIHHDEMPKEDRVYLTVNTTILQNNFDILAGHYRIGMLDSPMNMRHIVFLRQPQERYVSSILYRSKNQHSNHKAETVEDTAQYIKEGIFKARKKNDYNESIFKYLLTPEQVETMRKKKKGEDKTQEKTRLAIENLVHYNAIVGMTERFSESMLILKHVLLPDEFSSDEREEYVNEFFDEYTPSSSSSEIEEVPRENESQMGSISTSSVMAELKRDKAFMAQFVEFLKYEKIIVDFALQMHHIQFELVVDN